jgi:hypothetical protein
MLSISKSKSSTNLRLENNHARLICELFDRKLRAYQ